MGEHSLHLLHACDHTDEDRSRVEEEKPGGRAVRERGGRALARRSTKTSPRDHRPRSLGARTRRLGFQVHLPDGVLAHRVLKRRRKTEAFPRNKKSSPVAKILFYYTSEGWQAFHCSTSKCSLKKSIRNSCTSENVLEKDGQACEKYASLAIFL